MTRLCCFYNNLDPRTEKALLKYAPQAGLDTEWVDTTDPADQKYADELEKRWTGEEDLIVVEQDKEVHALCFPELTACPEPWCAYAYWISPVPHTVLAIGGFGVTKFSPEIQRAVPVSSFRGRRQKNIDRRFYEEITRLGLSCHLHGNVVHHHVYQPRPAAVRNHVENLRRLGALPPAVYPEPLAPHLLPGSYDLGG